MNPEELDNLYEFLFQTPEPFIDRLGLEDQKRYDSAFEELQKKVEIKKKIFIERKYFEEVIIKGFKLGAKCLKLHLIQESENLDLNIGISFSKEINHYNGSIANDIDFFWIVRNDRPLKIDRDAFKQFKDNFIGNKLVEIENYTEKSNNTQLIMYDIDYVIRYIIKNFFSSTFNITGIILNGIIFKNHPNPNKSNLNDKVGLSVHTVINEDFNKKDIPSIGYDFGTVYP